MTVTINPTALPGATALVIGNDYGGVLQLSTGASVVIPTNAFTSLLTYVLPSFGTGGKFLQNPGTDMRWLAVDAVTIALSLLNFTFGAGGFTFPQGELETNIPFGGSSNMMPSTTYAWAYNLRAII